MYILSQQAGDADASAFAAKLYQMFGFMTTLTAEQKESWALFIKSFENKHGEIYDPLIARKAKLGNMLSSARRAYFGNFFGAETSWWGNRSKSWRCCWSVPAS